jgi:methyl-accepting chemotaxis protein
VRLPGISPLGRQIVIPANAIAAFSLAALCAFLVFRGDRDSRQQLKGQATSMAAFLQQASASYITNYDLSALELFAKQAVKDEDFTFAVFLDDARKPLTAGVKPEIEASANVVEEAVRDPDGKVIGYVRLGYSTRRIEATLRQRIVISVAGLVLAQLLLALGLGLVVRSLRLRLARVVAQLSQTSDSTLGHADSVKSASRSVAEGASAQAASLATTRTSLEEISGMISRSANEASSVMEIATQASNSANSGVRQIESLVQAMAEIKASSADIGKILKTIDEIAFQTNILALNAAVEAARAGGAGAGFAVVADEVRALAQRSAMAARESAEKIEDAVAKGKRGDAISAGVAKNLNEIGSRVDKLCKFVASMASASQEQDRSIALVNDTVTDVEKITRQSASSANESASAAEELDSEALQLQEQVACLGALVNVSGSKRPPPARANTPAASGVRSVAFARHAQDPARASFATAR